MLAILLCLPGCASPDGAGELARLERENARLRAELEALRAELGVGGEPSAGLQLEQVFVPRSRVSLEVSKEAGSGNTRVASLWYRTADTRPLPRMEWLQVRAEQSEAGELVGAWLVLERHGGRGSLDTEAGSLSIDGRAVELRATSHETSRAQQSAGRIDSAKRQERVSFALPGAVLAQVGAAINVHFAAGSVEFDLTDEHLAAFAAVAARVGPARGAGGSR